MSPRHTIVVSIDRLHRGFVGAYGNAAVETPTLDELACRATVFDRFCIETLDVCATLQRLTASLPDANRVELVTDDGRVAESLRDAFQTTHVHQTLRPEIVPTDAEATHAARFFDDVAIVAERMRQRESSFLWCHYGGLGHCWDAPLAWRERYCDEGEGDPEPYAAATPPPLQSVTRGCDDDTIHAVQAAYAANVTLVDEWLGGFLDFYDSLDALLVVVATRGIPLGQHSLLGVSRDEADFVQASHVWSETVHVPLIVRFPNQKSARRIGSLVSTDDLATLWTLDASQTFAPKQSCVLIMSPDVEAIMTDEWFLRTRKDETNAPNHQLFAKPADRWDVNDVANRCADVIEMVNLGAELQVLR